MKALKIILVIVSIFSLQFTANAYDGTNENTNQRKIIISQTGQPHPHMADITEPVAMYTISNSTIDFTFDATYYSEYTIHLVSDYFEIDYFVYTPVVYIPVATLGDIVDIYIESDDCGCYYGTLDKSKY